MNGQERMSLSHEGVRAGNDHEFATRNASTSSDLLHQILPDKLIHPYQIERRVLARTVGERHWQPEHRHSAGDIVQAAHEVALAGDSDHRLRTPFADDAARELSARGDERGDAVALRDLEDSVERLAREAARDEDQKLDGFTRRSRASASWLYTATLA